MIVSQHCHLPALSASDNQIVPSIAIKIIPANPWPKLAQVFHKERLPFEIIKRLLGMDRRAKVPGLDKERRDLFHVGRVRPFGATLVNFVKEVCLRRNRASLATSPCHLYFQEVRESSRRKNSNGLIAGKITTATDHLLGLLDGAAANFDFCSNALRIRRVSFQAHGHAGSIADITIDSRRIPQILDNYIHPSIVIQVGQRHPLRDARSGESPADAHFLERPISLVAISDLGGLQSWKLAD